MKINNIYLGDSYKLIKKIEDKSIDCIYTDVPYLFDNGGGGSTELALRIVKNKGTELSHISDGIDYSIFDEFKRVMKKVNLFIWVSKNQIQDVMNYWLKDNDIFFEVLTWVKSNPTPQTNNVWLPDIEYCLYFRQKGVKLNDGYYLKSKWFLSPINTLDKYLYEHPTIKPLDLVKRHLLHTTQENDIVLDAFMGSGTTAVACKEIGRNYLGFEIDPKYHEISLNRLNGLSVHDIEKDIKQKFTIFDFITV